MEAAQGEKRPGEFQHVFRKLQHTGTLEGHCGVSGALETFCLLYPILPPSGTEEYECAFDSAFMWGNEGLWSIYITAFIDMRGIKQNTLNRQTDLRVQRNYN